MILPDRLMLFIHSRLLAVQRRWAIFRHSVFDPYPKCPEGLYFSPSQRTEAVARIMQPQLDWSDVTPNEVALWQKTARKRFRELLGISNTDPSLTIHSRLKMPIATGYLRERFYVHFGQNCDAPVDIVRKDNESSNIAGPTPVVICMQGTNAGAHLNLAEVRMPADVHKVASGSALALQAADNGFIAVSYERACFGERRELHLAKKSESPTVDAAFHSLALGETSLGQTVAELEALMCWIGDELAPGAPVYLAGYSAAGTAAIAAAAASVDFAGVAVGGCVGMMRDTILQRGAGGYNDLPDILKWFEFDALLALVAPRPCLVIAGVTDHIWPHSAAKTVMDTARRAWEFVGASDNLSFVRAPGVHTYYPDLLWPELNRLVAAQGKASMS